MKKMMIWFLPLIVFSLDFADVFKPPFDQKKFVGKRVTVKGTIFAKEKCENSCKILAKIKLNGDFVYVFLTYEQKYSKALQRKWVSNVVVSSCVFVDFLHYADCIN